MTEQEYVDVLFKLKAHAAALESRLAEAEARVKEADQKAKVIRVALMRLKWGIGNLSHPKYGAASFDASDFDDLLAELAPYLVEAPDCAAEEIVRDELTNTPGGSK